MISISIVNALYRELLLAAFLILSILLYNTLVLYKRKISDPLSVMLMSCVAMCIFEIAWEVFDENIQMVPLTYLSAGGYAISFLIFGATFNLFFMLQFGILPRKKWQQVAIYVVPNVVFSIICMTTPWSHLVFMADEKGILQEMILFHTAFYIILSAYLISAIIASVYFLLNKKHKNPVIYNTAKSVIIFALITPAFYFLQILIFKNPDSDYLALSLSCAIGLTYLVTNVSTHLLLDSQAKVDAIETDLKIASKIQTDALPPAAPDFPDHKDIELRASMNTAKEVGGDFYDYFFIDDNRLCLVMADVSGKGTPAALFMMTVKTMIKDYTLTSENTDEIFTAVNNRLCEKNEENMFATAWIGILDIRSMRLQYTNAGHNYPIIKHPGEDCTILPEVHGLFLGGMEDIRYKKSELTLSQGDRLLLYTDGATEAHNRENSLYGNDRLSDVINNAAGENGETLLNLILDDIKSFANGTPQFDDITMLVLTIK